MILFVIVWASMIELLDEVRIAIFRWFWTLASYIIIVIFKFENLNCIDEKKNVCNQQSLENVWVLCRIYFLFVLRNKWIRNIYSKQWRIYWIIYWLFHDWFVKRNFHRNQMINRMFEFDIRLNDKWRFDQTTSIFVLWVLEHLNDDC